MSLNGLFNTQFPLTIDGTTSLDASSITIDGQNIDLSNLVPYTAANQTVDLGSQIIKTTHTATTNPELINKGQVDGIIANLSVAIQGTFLDKVTVVPQSVLGAVSFTSDVALSAQTASRVLVLDGSQRITSSSISTTTLGFLDATSSIQNQLNSKASLAGGNSFTGSQNYADKTASTVAIFDTSTNLVSSAISTTELNHLGGTTSNIQTQLNGKLNLSGSNANQNISISGFKVQSTATPTLNQDYTTKIYVDNEIIGAGSLYLLKTGGTMTGDIVMGGNKVQSTATPTLPQDYTTKGYVDSQDSAQDAVISALSSLIATKANLIGPNTFSNTHTFTSPVPITLSGLTADRVVVLDSFNNLITSSVSTTTLGFLDATSSVQTQLNSKLNLSGGTVTGDLTVNGTTTIGTRLLGSPDGVGTGNFWLGLKGSGTEIQRLAIAIIGDQTVGEVTRVDIVKPFRLSNPTADRVLTVNGIGDVVSSSVTPTTLAFLDATSSVQTQLNSKLNLSGGDMTGSINFPIGQEISWGALKFSRILDDFQLRICTDDELTFNLGADNTTTGIVKMRLDFQGVRVIDNLVCDSFVGIGVTPLSKLHILSSGTQQIRLQTSAVDDHYITGANDLMALSANLSLTGIPNTARGSAQVILQTPTAGGFIQFLVSPAVNTAPLERMRISESGVQVVPNLTCNANIICDSNIGIGIAPLSKLHLNSIGTQQIRLQTSAVDNCFITAANDLMALNANLSLTGIPNVGRGSCSIVLQTPTAGGFIQFLTGSAVNTAPLERVRITGAGNLGIGTTTPVTALHIARAFSTNGDYSGMISFENTTVGFFEWQLGPQVIDNQAVFSLRGGSDGFGGLTNYINVSGAGNVGIGTTNPNAKLHVVGNTTTDGVVTINTGPGRGWIHNSGTVRLESFIDASGGWLGTFSNHPLHFYTNNSNQQMTLTTAGRLGIGTTTPTGVLALYSATASYNNSLVIQSDDGAGIMFDSTGGTGGRKYALLSSKQGYGIGAGGFGIYDETAGAYRLSINSSGNTTIDGNVGIGVTPATDVQLKLLSTIANRKIVLWDGGGTSDHQFYGIGINNGTLRFNVFDTTAGFSFFAGTSATTSTDPVRINGTGLIETGVTGNTTANLKLASSASHIDNNPGEVLLFTGFQGHVAIGRNTVRNATTANLCLGVASTEESQIISRKTDDSGVMPLSFSSSKYSFVTGNDTDINFITYDLRGQTSFDGSNLINLQCQASAFGRNQLILTGRYEGGNDGWSFATPRNAIRFRTQSSLNSAYTNRWTIQNFDDALGFLSSDTPTMVLRGSNVGIGTTTPSRPLTVSTPTTEYGLSHIGGGVEVATFVGGSSGGGWIGTASNHSFSIYTNNSAARLTVDVSGNIGIGTTTPAHFVNWVGNVDGGVEQYGQNQSTGTSAYTLIGVRNNTPSQLVMFLNSTTRTADGGASTGTVRNDAGALRLQSTGGNGIFIASSSGNTTIGGRLAVGGTASDGILDIRNPNATYTHFGWTDNINYIRGVRTNFDCPVAVLANRFSVGETAPRTLMTLTGGDNGAPTTRFGNVSSWPDGANGCLYSQDANTDANSAGLFVGYNGADFNSYITSLAPNVSWLNLRIFADETEVFRLGTLVAYTDATGWVNVSDEREKEDIHPLKTDHSLERVLALKPKHYRRKYSESAATPVPQKEKEKRLVGFIAQEVQLSNPHCISTWCNDEAKEDDTEDDGGRLGMSYNDYVVHLVGAVQEQQKQIGDLQHHVKVLEEREVVWVKHAREQEEKMAKMAKDMEKMAGLLAQLLPK